MSKANKSGFRGVLWDKRTKSWAVCAVLNYKTIFLGRYADVLDAALARLTWESQCEFLECDRRNYLVKSIKEEWPEFNHKADPFCKTRLKQKVKK